ncbi:uncharacterized protein LOC121051106 [Rosa chinensis]|uniref:uncharacterized protein LOC121051106 n=1 Tax=Rosa chinensis TaxID=74649 RepID=UPI001AD8FA35|nr:uncharacterized protein LOC121051106 [Rosa chinensis]
MEMYRDESVFTQCYSIQAIDLTDLLSFSDTPITISFSRSPPTKAMGSPPTKVQDHILREVDFLQGNDVPYDMGFGVFGSQIVLAGGLQLPQRHRTTSKVYVLDTLRDKPKFVKRKANKPKRRDHGIPEFQSPKRLPQLMEIEGKLYALDLRPQQGFPSSSSFEVFDPQTGSWAALPDHPPPIIQCRGPLSCAVVGTKFLISACDTPVYCFDVAEPTRPWNELCVRHDRHKLYNYIDPRALPFLQVLVLDLEEENHKILFSSCGNDILVFHMNLSNDLALELIATIEVDIKFDDCSVSFIHLGGQKVCFVFLDWWIFDKMRGVFFTFEYSFSKSAASPDTHTSSCGDDPYFRVFYPSNSNGRSFSAKTLGWRTFEYHYWSEEASPISTDVCGSAVLPLHPRHREERAICKSCGRYFPDIELFNRHLSINPCCRSEQRLIQCKFCGCYFSKQELFAHFSTSVSCKSKFTGNI